MTSLLVNLGGLLLIAAIIWWFWFSKPGARIAPVEDDTPINVLVDGGVYVPAIIGATVGQPLVLEFLRKDTSPCAEKVIFNEMGLSVDLVVDQPKEVRITPSEVGEISFTCQMGMYQGRIQVT